MTTIARNSDPTESKQAAQEITQDGTRAAMSQLALDAVKLTPGSTANELELANNLKDGQLRKRMKELENDGHVYRGTPRQSRVTGKTNVTWWPTVETQPQASQA